MRHTRTSTRRRWWYSRARSKRWIDASGPMDLVYYSGGVPHGIRNPCAEPARYVVIEFHGRRTILAQGRRSASMGPDTACHVESPITFPVMKLVAVFSAAMRTLKDEWFLGTLKDDYDVGCTDAMCGGKGRTCRRTGRVAVLFKSRDHRQGHSGQLGRNLCLLGRGRHVFRADQARMSEEPRGQGHRLSAWIIRLANLCTGFFAVRANDTNTQALAAGPSGCRTRAARPARLQPSVREMTGPARRISSGVVLRAGNLFRAPLRRRERFYIPADPVMFHANFTVGVDNKMKLLTKSSPDYQAGRMGAKGEQRLLPHPDDGKDVPSATR